MRLAIVVLALLVSAPALACGFWNMQDHEKKLSIGFLINSASITNAGGKRVGAFYLDVESGKPPRTVQGKKVVYDVKGDKLLKRGKAVATLDGNTLQLGRRAYTIELTNPHEEHGMPAWKLAVRRGDQVVIEAEHASSLCAAMARAKGEPMTTAEHEDDVRRRVIYYLAWRDLAR